MYQTCLGSLKSTCQEVVLKVLLLRHNCIKALLVFNDNGRIPGNFTRQDSQWDFPFLYPNGIYMDIEISTGELYFYRYGASMW